MGGFSRFLKGVGKAPRKFAEPAYRGTYAEHLANPETAPEIQWWAGSPETANSYAVGEGAAVQPGMLHGENLFDVDMGGRIIDQLRPDEIRHATIKQRVLRSGGGNVHPDTLARAATDSGFDGVRWRNAIASPSLDNSLAPDTVYAVRQSAARSRFDPVVQGDWGGLSKNFAAAAASAAGFGGAGWLNPDDADAMPFKGPKLPKAGDLNWWTKPAPEKLAGRSTTTFSPNNANPGFGKFPGMEAFAAGETPAMVGGTPEALARAKAQGFDTSTKLYHGTTKDISAFDRGFSAGGRGIHTSVRPEIASGKRYVGSLGDDAGNIPSGDFKPTPDGEGGNVMPLFARGPIAVEGRDYHVGAPMEEWESRLRAKGFTGYRRDSGAKTNGVGRFNEVVLFDPKDLRSVHAAFDPSKSGSSDLLAGGLLALGGAGAAGAALNPGDADAARLRAPTAGPADRFASGNVFTDANFSNRFWRDEVKGIERYADQRSARRSDRNFTVPPPQQRVGALGAGGDLFKRDTQATWADMAKGADQPRVDPRVFGLLAAGGGVAGGGAAVLQGPIGQRAREDAWIGDAQAKQDELSRQLENFRRTGDPGADDPFPANAFRTRAASDINRIGARDAVRSRANIGADTSAFYARNNGGENAFWDRFSDNLKPVTQFLPTWEEFKEAPVRSAVSVFGDVIPNVLWPEDTGVSDYGFGRGKPRTVTLPQSQYRRAP